MSSKRRSLMNGFLYHNHFSPRHALSTKVMPERQGFGNWDLYLHINLQYQTIYSGSTKYIISYLDFLFLVDYLKFIHRICKKVYIFVRMEVKISRLWRAIGCSTYQYFFLKQHNRTKCPDFRPFITKLSTYILIEVTIV